MIQLKRANDPTFELVAAKGGDNGRYEGREKLDLKERPEEKKGCC